MKDAHKNTTERQENTKEHTMVLLENLKWRVETYFQIMNNM